MSNERLSIADYFIIKHYLIVGRNDSLNATIEDQRMIDSDEFNQAILNAYHSEAIEDKEHLIGSVTDLINELITEEEVKLKESGEY